jgi:diadenylate cyclase
VVVHDARLSAAGCLLPVSQNSEISKDMGTRHRAAIGLSESTDALVVVVSEETGIISLAQNGIILRRLDRANLYRILEAALVPRDDEDGERPGIFGRIFRR